jgi:hypothetical protein
MEFLGELLIHADHGNAYRRDAGEVEPVVELECVVWSGPGVTGGDTDTEDQINS